MEVYVDYHRPTWHLAWGVESLWRNESAFAFPTMPAEIFTARAWILDEPADGLVAFVDIPWCHADLFYIQKLVLCIEAAGTTRWEPADTRRGESLALVGNFSKEGSRRETTGPS